MQTFGSKKTSLCLRIQIWHHVNLDNLVNSTIPRFVAAKASDQPVFSPAVSDRSDTIRVVLPFKDQASADIVRSQLKDLSQKIQTTVQPVFVSQKIGRDLKLREAKPPIVNQQCLVYKFNYNKVSI